MKRWRALIAVGGLTACHGPSAPNQAPNAYVIPTVPVVAAPAASSGVRERPTRDPVVRLARRIEEVVGRQDWGAFLDLCHADHRATQLRMGVKEPQYIAEVLGIHTVGNSIARGPVQREHLASITSVEIDDDHTRARSGEVQLQGRALLSDGRELAVRVLLIERDGRLWITGAVG